MQRCFLVINKETSVTNYLKHRSIVDVTEEHRSLLELNLERLDIIDVEKFLYIYYQTDDSDLSFRSDMNALRTLTNSAFFHASEMIFILVNSGSPFLQDLIYSALRESNIPKDRIEIIQHEGSLLLSDVGKYLSGSSSGQTTSSSYRDVFVTEADKEEKERFVNTSSGIDAVLPVLTDMAALYAQRSGVEAISAGRMVSESSIRPSLVKDFTRINVSGAKAITSFVVSGERWAGAESAVGYLIQYQRAVGVRSLVINLDPHTSFEDSISPATTLGLLDIKAPITPEHSTAIINARLNQLGYIVEYLKNIRGVGEYIFYADAGDYSVVSELVRQLAETTHPIYVAHYHPDSLQRYLEQGVKSTALFLSFGKFSEEFDLKKYKAELKGTIVAQFPERDVDYTEFYEFSTGGERNE